MNSIPAADPERLLRLTLTTNALVTAASGALLVVGAGALHSPLGLASGLPLVIVGGLFLAFAGQVWLARRSPIDRRQALAIFVLDVAYVLATAAFLFAWPHVLSALGRWLAIFVAEVVALFALGEWMGLRRLAARGNAATA
jgi:hypothetical protein